MNNYLNSIKNCFSNEKVNMGSQHDIDLARGLSFVFLIWIHTLDKMEALFTNTSALFTKVIDILGGPCAMPIYMICVGVSIAYANDGQEEMEHEGFHLLIEGTILNFFKNVVPYIIDGLTLGTSIHFSHIFCGFFEGDILQFVGLVFIVIGLFEKQEYKKQEMVVLALIGSIIGYIFRYHSTGIEYIDVFLGWFIGTEMSELPLLNWFIFPVFGYIYGEKMEYCKDKETFYKLVGPLGIIGLLYYVILSYLNIGAMSLGSKNFYFLGLIDANFSCLLAIGIFGLCLLIYDKFGKNILAPLFRFSNNIGSIEIAHWIILMSLITILHHFYLKNIEGSELIITLVAVMIIVLSETISEFIRKVKQKLHKND